MIYTPIPVALPYVKHIRLPDRHNVANHFCPQSFLSEQFSKFVCVLSFHCYFIGFFGGFFQKVI